MVDDIADTTHSTDDMVAARAEGLTALRDSDKLREAEGAGDNETDPSAGGATALTTTQSSSSAGGVSLFAAASMVRNARAFQRRSRAGSFEGRGEYYG